MSRRSRASRRGKGARRAGRPGAPQRGCSTKKRCFPTEEAARDRLAEIHATENPGRDFVYMPVNVYPCGKCKSWHLTSKAMKAWKHGKRR